MATFTPFRFHGGYGSIFRIFWFICTLSFCHLVDRPQLLSSIIWRYHLLSLKLATLSPCQKVNGHCVPDSVASVCLDGTHRIAPIGKYKLRRLGLLKSETIATLMHCRTPRHVLPSKYNKTILVIQKLCIKLPVNSSQVHGSRLSI